MLVSDTVDHVVHFGICSRVHVSFDIARYVRLLTLLSFYSLHRGVVILFSPLLPYSITCTSCSSVRLRVRSFPDNSLSPLRLLNNIALDQIVPLTILNQREHRYGGGSPSDHVSAYGDQQESIICSSLCVGRGTIDIPNARIMSGTSSAGLRRSMRSAAQTVRSKSAHLCKVGNRTGSVNPDQTSDVWLTAKAESCTRRLVGEVTRTSATGGCCSASKNVRFASDQGDIQLPQTI